MMFDDAQQPAFNLTLMPWLVKKQRLNSQAQAFRFNKTDGREMTDINVMMLVRGR